MILRGSLAALLLAGNAATAETLLGPEDVWPSFEYGRCDAYLPDFSCLRAAGAPEGALRFVEYAAANPDIGMLVIPTAFVELGAVDLVEVNLPGMVNTNWQQMLVNGDPGIVFLANWSSSFAGVDGGTRAVLRRYPQATPSGRVTVQGYRALPGGIQRFVMADMLVDGCRACEPVGSSLFQMDFIDGAFSSVMYLGWVLAEGEASQAQIAGKLQQGDIALLQTLLNLHGFQAGSMDGAAGPATRAALDDFKAEHCLSGDADLSPRVVAALSAPGPTFQQPSCARALAPRLKNPLALPDGQYVTDPKFCLPEDPNTQDEMGDLAYSNSVTLAGDKFLFSEATCTILSVTPDGAAIDLQMACLNEGFDEDRMERVLLAPPDAFAWRGQKFEHCGAASVTPKAAVPVPSDPDGTPVFPLENADAAVNAIFGAAGPGPVSDPAAYFSGQFHTGLDLQAGKDAKVIAPVDGRIVYYHRNAANGEPRWLQTFFVLRDGLNRDWIFAHVDCGACSAQPGVGDLGSWPQSPPVDIRAGDPLGTVANLLLEGYGPHLHLGLSSKPIVGPDGMLLPEYRAGNWARLLYQEDQPGSREAIAAKAAAIGFVDPLSVLRP